MKLTRLSFVAAVLLAAVCLSGGLGCGGSSSAKPARIPPAGHHEGDGHDHSHDGHDHADHAHDTHG